MALTILSPQATHKSDAGGVPPTDLDAVLATLCAVSHLLAEMPQIAEFDINPLLADAAGVAALDARVRVSAAAPGGAANFAIRPYPAELIESIEWQYRHVVLGPLRPQDEEQHLAIPGRLDATDIRKRGFCSRRSTERTELARLTQMENTRMLVLARELGFEIDPDHPGDDTVALTLTLAPLRPGAP